ETVLISAVASGVGLAAVQLVRAVQAVTFGTARTAGKIDHAKVVWFEDGLVGRDNLVDLVGAAKRWTGERGIAVLLDLAGGAYVNAGQRLLALKGRMMLVGTIAGGNYELDARYVMSKRLEIRGTVLRARSLEEKMQATQSFASEVVPLLARGVLRPIIDSKFSPAAIGQ